MKSMKVILGVAFLAVLAGTANAATNTVGLTGGMGIPTGNYSDAAANGWNLGVTGTHMVNSQWGFGGDVAYHAWGGSKNANAAAELVYGPGSDFKWSAVQATAHAVMAFPTQSSMKPYAKVGAGLYDVDLKLESPSGNGSISL